MTKKLFVLCLACGLMLLGAAGVLAGECESGPEMFLDLYKVDDAFAVGIKKCFVKNLYGTLNIEYHETANDLEFQAGAIYLLPHEVLFFKFYGGGGVQLSRNLGYEYPYLVLGTNFLFLFSEVVYPLEKEAEPRYRGGFSFEF